MGTEKDMLLWTFWLFWAFVEIVPAAIEPERWRASTKPGKENKKMINILHVSDYYVRSMLFVKIQRSKMIKTFFF